MDSGSVADHITKWLKAYAEDAGMVGFVIGISGGIDSAVTSTLCARTGLKVLCMQMSIHQNHNHVSRARAHINFLKVNYPEVTSQDVELTSVFDAFVSALPQTSDRELHEFALVNTRARLRMSTLYYFAALQKMLVAGTGNKIEDFGIGFYTKYGDGGVDLSPIADLTKTQVYELGSELGIHQEIMEAAPTDGLWGDNRTDEDQIGASYSELEWAMSYKGDNTNLSERQHIVLEIYSRLHEQNQHKMVPIPVCKIPEDLMDKIR